MGRWLTLDSVVLADDGQDYLLVEIWVTQLSHAARVAVSAKVKLASVAIMLTSH